MNVKERCYLRDAYVFDFTAKVRESIRMEDGKFGVYLDKTYFYPVSGGQPEDSGTLGGRRVVAVTEDEKGVLHTIDGELDGMGEIEGHIDAHRRLDHMQQHTGQHLLSRVFLEMFKARTVGFHLGERYSTIDLDGYFPSDVEIDAVESRVNGLVRDDLPVASRIIGAEEYERIRSRRPGDGADAVRSRLPGGVESIRIVEIEGVECSTCCGTHCKRTGEIGLVKILGVEKVKGKARVEFVCGGRAVSDYGGKHRVLRSLALQFSTDWRGLEQVVGKLVEENRALGKEKEELTRELAHFRAVEFSEPTGNVGGIDIVKRVFEGEDAGALRRVAFEIRDSKSSVVLFGITGPSPGLVFACTPGLPLEMGELLKLSAGVMGARGGGGKDFAQGGGGDGGKVQEALDKAETSVKELLGG